MALLLDGSLPSLYDFAIDGVGYLVAWKQHVPPFRFAYTEEFPDTVIERRDSNNVEQLSDNKLDYFGGSLSVRGKEVLGSFGSTHRVLL